MKIRVIETKGSTNKLTLTTNEARLKLTENTKRDERMRIDTLTETIRNTIDKDLLVNTLRGDFRFKDDNLYIVLKYGRKTGKCIVYFDEKGKK